MRARFPGETGYPAVLTAAPSKPQLDTPWSLLHATLCRGAALPTSIPSAFPGVLLVFRFPRRQLCWPDLSQGRRFTPILGQMFSHPPEHP